ncbi:MAG: hypothetical protein AAGE52_36730 [Myxococcota bacterium]
MTRYARRYRKVARSLSRLELMETSMGDDWDPRDLVSRGPRRFLDFYGDEGLRLGMERYGLYDVLKRRGYSDLTLRSQAADDRHTLIVEGSHPELPEPTHLVELVVRRDLLVPEASTGMTTNFQVLTVDWLTLRHPAGTFTQERPQLPGQDAPGLGLSERVAELLYRVVDRLHLDGLVTVAEYFHNAVIYRREFSYFDPVESGRYDALYRDLMNEAGLNLAQASWAVDWGFVTEVEQGTFKWKGEALVHAMAPRLLSYLTSSAHRRAAKEAARGVRFEFDRAGFDERWASLGSQPVR